MERECPRKVQVYIFCAFDPRFLSKIHTEYVFEWTWRVLNQEKKKKEKNAE